MHIILEWLLVVSIGAIGFALNKWAPLKKMRYFVYALIFLGAFIFDLNNVSFAANSLNALLYLVILTAMTELVWLCAAKKSKILLGAALVVFVPVFVSILISLLVIMPLPCHENKNVIVDKYTCASESYILKRRPSLDVYEPKHVYTLYRSIQNYPIVRKIDKYITPEGYFKAYINPRHQCFSDWIKIDLYAEDSYILWSLGVGKR